MASLIAKALTFGFFAALVLFVLVPAVGSAVLLRLRRNH